MVTNENFQIWPKLDSTLYSFVPKCKGEGGGGVE